MLLAVLNQFERGRTIIIPGISSKDAKTRQVILVELDTYFISDPAVTVMTPTLT
jgi:hypothetical protein